MMKKKNTLLILISILFIIAIIGLISAVTITQTFYDGFEVDDLATNWTANAAYVRSQTTVQTGLWSIEVDGNVADATMEVTNGLDITNYTNCTVSSSIYIETGFDGNEYVCLDYSTDGGTSWNRDTGSDGIVGDLCQDGNVDTENAWRNISYDQTTTSGITSFKFRFRTYVNNQNEDAYIDTVNVTCWKNIAPNMTNMTQSHTTIKGGDTITFYANTSEHIINDTEGNALTLYCDNSTTPNATNTDCTGGTNTDTSYPYVLSCSFAAPTDDTTHEEFCRVYDGTDYSSAAISANYTTDSTPPTTTINNIAGDPEVTYFDTINDAHTDIILEGEASMLCRWATSDLAYSGMVNDCTISGIQANCSISGTSDEGLYTRYTSCQDSLANEQNTSQNLDIQFFVDYNAPTTTDNSTTAVVTPSYTINITEIDTVDTDPTTFYCTDTTGSCTPLTSIDNGGTITFSSSSRGKNYLRYYSTDDAGNTQTTTNKSININQLPVFLGVTDNATTVKGGSTINISANFSDGDSGQEITLYVCNSQNANQNGCIDTHYCNSTNTLNTSCILTSETDSATHTWYAFIYDELNEAAVVNFSGSYTTDSTGPVLTIVSPLNQTYSQSTITASISLDETGSWAVYSLNHTANVSMTNTTDIDWTATLTELGDNNHNITFFAKDKYGNLGNTSIRFFSINTAGSDTTAPTISIWSPVNNTYYTNAASILLNITTDENVSWAGYSINSTATANLDNYSTTNWNATYSFSEGQQNITFYANDSSNNQGRKDIFIYTDTVNPYIENFSCDSVINDSIDINCNANVSDWLGLDYAIIGHNLSGSWENSSQISLSGNASEFSYTINSANSSPGFFAAGIYVYDLSGRVNATNDVFNLTILDDTFPKIYNITYYPNSTNDLDPGTTVYVNTTIVEDYGFGEVYLMYQNASVGTWSLINMTNFSARTINTAMIYNGTFVPQSDTWYFQINATDSVGNQNISSNTSIVVATENTQNISTTIPDIKSFTIAEAGNNKSIGYIIMNNTGDDTLNFNVTITSDTIQTRMNINHTDSQTKNYTIDAGQEINISIGVNTTSLAISIYNYSMNISTSINSTTYNKQINIQNVAGPYLTTTIDTYDPTVTAGQENVEFSVSVENSGTQAATGVYLNWTLPSGFSLNSGSLNRNLGTLPIGISGTNTITVNIASDADEGYVNITAIATSTNADSSSTFKQITIGTPPTVTETTTTSTEGGGGGAATAGTAVVYDDIIEIVRGKTKEFEIQIDNPYINSSLEELTLELTGYLTQYVDVILGEIDKIKSGETKSFIVKLTIPSYEEFKDYTLTAKISGKLITPTKIQSYRETQTIKLRIQEIPKEEALASLENAKKAIELMQEAGFNIKEAESLLEQAKQKLEEGVNNNEIYNLAQKIIEIKDLAFEADDLISRIKEVLKNPRKIGLITGNVAREIINLDGEAVPTKSLLTGKAIFGSKSAKDILDLATAAFLRGDYALSIERAKSAQILLILERKGNFALFLYLYWHIILISILFFSFIGIIGHRQYQRATVSRKIIGINKEEKNIKETMKSSQKKYFSGKISASQYDRANSQHQKRLAQIKKARLNLRNKRIKILESRQILKELDSEKNQAEEEIKELQTAFYKTRKISEKEYKMQFKILNERLTEIESERATLDLVQKKEHQAHPIQEKTRQRLDKVGRKISNIIIGVKEKLHKNKKLGKIKIRKTTKETSKKIISLITKPFIRLRKKIINRDSKKGVMLIDGEVIQKLKELTKNHDCKGKWVHIVPKSKKAEMVPKQKQKEQKTAEHLLQRFDKHHEVKKDEKSY